MNFLICAALCSLPILTCHAGIEQHFRKITDRTGSSKLENIDFIYLINLDQRPEKLELCKQLLTPYNIYPQRFPAIYGWALPASVFNDVGVKFLPGMWSGIDRALYFPYDWNGSSLFVRLDASCYGGAFFSGHVTNGAVGCTLSHLSVLQDAYEAGYNTIWILEDDITILDDPHKLSKCIADLDALIGKDAWDVLYTDGDYLKGLNRNEDLQAQMPFKWRPDMPYYDLEPMLEYTEVGDNFAKIGSRTRTHSMILRRSGICKILDFYKIHNMFMPYDHEIAFVPDIKLYIMKHAIVSTKEDGSDTKFKHFH